jgi:hypothetical protein
MDVYTTADSIMPFYRYWGPMKMISSVQDSGAYLAFEDFKEDTIVDVKPYTPAAMHPLYTTNQFTVGTDTSGFMLDKSGSTPSLVYRHKPGVQYPVTCLVAPETNLEWKNYIDSGVIIKPYGSVFDTAAIGLVFYYSNSSSCYYLKNGHDSLFIDGGGITKIYLPGISFSNGDSLYFKILVQNADLNNIPEKRTLLKVDLRKNNQPYYTTYFNGYDGTSQHLTTGYSGVYVDLSNVNDYTNRNLAPILIKNFFIRQ